MKHVRNHRIVVAVEMSRPDGQRRLQGLMRYLSSHKIHWDLRIKRTVAECTARSVAEFPAWDIDGVIYAHPQYSEDARAALSRLLEMNLPLVVLDPGDTLPPEVNRRDLAIVRTDPDSIGEIAAQCFISQGVCRSYGYVPDILDRTWSRRRGNAFAAALKGHQASCRIYRPEHVGQNDFAQLLDWLKTLPKPAGVLAAYDDRALTVLEACEAAGITIPGQVSLLSVDDDELICENCRPALSSIRPDQERSGYVAGALLSSLLKSGCNRPHVTALPVKSISHRKSTLMASQSGRLVQRALGYIRQNCRRHLTAALIADHLGVSRPLLDLRFRELLGTSVGRTIESERLNAVCKCLVSGNATIKEIAESCGYSDPFQLMHRFKHHFGITATAYRRNATSLSPADHPPEPRIPSE